jgi:hypothetical protein
MRNSAKGMTGAGLVAQAGGGVASSERGWEVGFTVRGWEVGCLAGWEVGVVSDAE